MFISFPGFAAEVNGKLHEKSFSTCAADVEVWLKIFKPLHEGHWPRPKVVPVRITLTKIEDQSF